MFTRRNYVIVGVLVGIVTFLVATFAGPDLSVWITQVQTQSQGSVGGLTVFIGEPIKWVLQNPAPGALVTALLWPVGGLWLLMLFFMAVIGFGAPAAGDVRRQF